LLLVRHFENIFDSIGLSFIFNQMPINLFKFGEEKLQTLQEVISIFKQLFCLESYLLRFDQQNRNFITKFRVSNTKLPIETGRWYNISKDHRKCTKCSENLIGDEFHYLLICSHPEIVNLSVRYIPNYYLSY
jgi:hypothetical protein